MSGAPPGSVPVPANRDVTAPDRELVSRMATGDEQALGRLYDRHGRTFHALALAILGEQADAEEVVADVFVQAWRTAATFDPARGSVHGWLATITRTRALDVLRRRGRRSRALDRVAHLSAEGGSDVAPPGESPERSVEAGEIGRLVRQALDQLPGPQRQVIELAYFGGLSQSEIAAELRLPLGTVKTRMLTGMQRLRASLAPVLGEEVA
jgi:RNA polymerase sigma-70 factor (ECF subfamily)